MSERIGAGFRGLLVGVALFGASTIAAALVLIFRGSLFDGLVIGTVAILLLRWFWRATARKRALSRRGFHPGRRAGNVWLYEELHGDQVESLGLPLDYVGRGEYEIHIPGERDWIARMPDWARGRRDEIVERLQTVFKRSQIHFDTDLTPAPPAHG
jgi:hypothetical protein